MDIITIDFETYWDSDYSLAKLPPLEYVRSDKFQLISCAFKLNDGPAYTVFGEPEIRAEFQNLSPHIERGILLAHNMSGFDAYICAYYLGVTPLLWADTLAMARPHFAKTCGVSLAALVTQHAAQLTCWGVPAVKDNTALIQTKGKRLEDFTYAERSAMGAYNAMDVEQCYALWRILQKRTNATELWHIDTRIRMRTEPKFEVDTALLADTLREECEAKLTQLIALAEMLGVPPGSKAVKQELASSVKFAALLTRLGVAVPMKPSPTNPKRSIPALSKTDEEFIALQSHPDERVAAAALARLSVKSTLLETRISKFLDAARYAGGRLPVPLRYCGADTTGRDSGEEYNCQNLPRIGATPRRSDALRLSLRAPKGTMVIVADQSGIELRVNHFLWREPGTMSLYKASPDKADPYREFAAVMFGIPTDKVTKAQRQFGKLCQLGLGFGAGAAAFRNIAKAMGGLDISEEEAEAAVGLWRRTYRRISSDGWGNCNGAILDMATGRASMAVDTWGLVHTDHERLVLPSGRTIYYPGLRQENNGQWPDGRSKRAWFYAEGRHKATLTGPKVDENIVQALARDSVFDCAVEFFMRTQLRPALMVHDELVYIVEESLAPDFLAELQQVVRTPPKWWAGLVVWSEGSMAPTYGEAK